MLGLIVFLQGRSDRLLAAVVDPLHPDWLGMQRAFTGFTIYAASLVGALALAMLLLARAVHRRWRLRQVRVVSPRWPAGGLALAVALTAAVVLVFIEVLIFQDYGIHFYEFDVFGILADAALRRDLGIQPAEVARVTLAAAGLLVAELGLVVAAARLVDWRNGALPRACGTAMVMAIPGGFALFTASEQGIGPVRSEFESALPLGRQLLLRTDSRPHIAVAPRVGGAGYPMLAATDAAPALPVRPNIVFYVPDGLRADMIRPELTPTLLAFGARRDVLSSDRHFSSGHVSEAGIFGLLYAVGSHAYNAFVGERVPAYPVEVLRRNGYHTLLISSSRLNPYPTDQLMRTFDEVVYPGDDDDALERLRSYVAQRRADGRPYFVLAFMYTPHYPFTSAKPHLRRYPSIGPKARTDYMNDVIQADEFFRQAQGILGHRDSTIVMVTSDHGEEIRDHGVFGHASATFWNEKVQVPLFLRLPGREFPPDVRVPLSSHSDVWPTVFEHLGLPVEAERYSDGRSLLSPEPDRGNVLVAGRFFPFADRPSMVTDGVHKIWFRAVRVGRDTTLCVEVTRVTRPDDTPVTHAGQTFASHPSIVRMQRSFWRFLRYVGPQTAPCLGD